MVMASRPEISTAEGCCRLVADKSLDGVSVRTLNSLAASERTSAAKVFNIAARGVAAARVRAHVKEVEHLKNRVHTGNSLYTKYRKNTPGVGHTL
jgi:hypothetical protein